jgi:hypothetical protein
MPFEIGGIGGKTQFDKKSAMMESSHCDSTHLGSILPG